MLPIAPLGIVKSALTCPPEGTTSTVPKFTTVVGVIAAITLVSVPPVDPVGNCTCAVQIQSPGVNVIDCVPPVDGHVAAPRLHDVKDALRATRLANGRESVIVSPTKPAVAESFVFVPLIEKLLVEVLITAKSVAAPIG